MQLFGDKWNQAHPSCLPSQATDTRTRDDSSSPAHLVVDVLVAWLSDRPSLFDELAQHDRCGKKIARLAEEAAAEVMQEHLNEMAVAVYTHLKLTERGYQSRVPHAYQFSYNLFRML